MDIFIIKTESTKNIPENLLHDFMYRNISAEKKQKIHALSYLMTDRILRTFYGINDTEIEFVNEKPMLKNRQKRFSISHSGDYIALGFSDFNCGIDIEKVKSRDFKPIAKRMNFLCENINEFYEDWTKYEAEYKLNEPSKSLKVFRYEDYMLTAASTAEEKFELYVQTLNDFSKPCS